MVPGFSRRVARPLMAVGERVVRRSFPNENLPSKAINWTY